MTWTLLFSSIGLRQGPGFSSEQQCISPSNSTRGLRSVYKRAHSNGGRLNPIFDGVYWYFWSPFLESVTPLLSEDTVSIYIGLDTILLCEASTTCRIQVLSLVSRIEVNQLQEPKMLLAMFLNPQGSLHTKGDFIRILFCYLLDKG